MLNVTQIDAHYGAVKALYGVSLKVEPKEIVCIIGANGAGKTTLLNVISGIHEQSKGKVSLNQKPLPQGKAEVAVSKGIVQAPEGRQVFEPLSVLDNLLLGAFLRLKKQRSQVEEDLETVFQTFPILKKRKTQLAGTLSGGEQQMLAIARALMASPKILLLDEPSLGLAPLFVKEIFRIIKDLPQKDCAVLLVEQNARQALKTADRGYVMVNGRITKQGSSKQLLADNDVAQAFLGAKTTVNSSEKDS